MIRASQTTTVVSSLPSGSTVHGQVHNWIKFCTAASKRTWKQEPCSQLALLAPQMPTGTLGVVVHSLSLNPFLPKDHESLEGWVQIDWSLIPTSPGPSRLQGTLQILSKCFHPPPGSDGPKQPMRCGRSLGKLGVSWGKEGCLFFVIPSNTSNTSTILIQLKTGSDQ